MAEQYEGLLEVFPHGGEGLGEFFNRLKWSSEDLRAFVGTMRRVGDFEKLFASEEVAGLLSAGDFFQVLGDATQSKAVVSGRARKQVRFRMNESGKQYVRSLYGDYYDLQFDEKRGIHHPHPVVRFSKDTIDAYVWERLVGTTVLEVGPNPVTAIRRGVVQGEYYGLLPKLSASDLERRATAVGHTRRALAAGVYQGAQATAASDFLRGNLSDIFLPLRVQDVTVPVGALVALDSAYDVPLADFVAAMVRCGAPEGYVSMVTIPHPSLGVTSGRVGSSEMVFSVADGRYDFFFSGSSTRAYTHVKEVVDEYFMHEVREVLCGDSRYIVARMPVSNEVVTLWHIYLAPRGLVGEASRPTYVKVGDVGRVVIETTAVDVRYPKGAPGRFPVAKYDLGVETFSRALGERLRDTTPSSTRVFNHLRSNRSNVVYAGVLRSVDEPLPMDSLSGLAVAVDAYAKQLEVATDVEVAAVKASMAKGGWFGDTSFLADACQIVKDKAVELVVEGLEVPLVTVSVVKDVLVVPNEPIVLGVEGNVSFCRRAAVAVDVVHRYGKAAADAEGLAEWYAAALRGCGCASCELREKFETEDQFFDCVSENTVVDEEDQVEESVFDFFSKFDDTKLEDGDVPVGVAESVERAVLADYLFILGEQMATKKAKAKEAAEMLVQSGGFSVRKLQTYSSEVLRHFWVKVGSCGEIISVEGGGKVDSLGLVYDPRRERFMRPVRLGERVCVEPEAYGDCYSNSALEVWNGPELVERGKAVLADPAFGSGRTKRDFKFVNGIWGAGKSFLGKEWFKAVFADGGRPMFLSASKDPADEVRKQLYGDKDDIEGKKWVRTVHSALINVRGGKPVTHLLVDEAAMLHPAEIFMLWWMLRPKVMWLAGDIMQNEYCTFVAGLDARFQSVAEFCDIALLREGHRVPFDVYVAGLDVYGEDSGIHPCSCHERDENSLDCVKINSVEEVPSAQKVLTHLQRTKQDMRKLMVARGCSAEEAAERVSTGVEFQGGTSDGVALVRDVLPKKKGTLFHELKRANVMMSRSTSATVYYTRSDEKDALVGLIESSRDEYKRGIIKENIRRSQENGGKDKFGMTELRAFVDGSLDEVHPALVAGRKLKERVMAQQ